MRRSKRSRTYRFIFDQVIVPKGGDDVHESWSTAFLDAIRSETFPTKAAPKNLRPRQSKDALHKFYGYWWALHRKTDKKRFSHCFLFARRIRSDFLISSIFEKI